MRFYHWAGQEMAKPIRILHGFHMRYDCNGTKRTTESISHTHTDCIIFRLDTCMDGNNNNNNTNQQRPI